MPDNTVTLVGNVTRDPELRFTPSGQAVATFGLAVNRRWQNRQNEWEEQVSFFDVKCWAQMAENVSESLNRGSRVVVSGPARAAFVGIRAGREAIQDRGRRRRDRPQPALGNRVDHPQRAPRGPGREPVRGGRRKPSGSQRTVWRPHIRNDEEPFLMARKPIRGKNKDNARRSKKKISILSQERVEYVDYKDVNLLRRFMSDRGKIRARRVTGNSAQQQAAVAMAIKKRPRDAHCSDMRTA